MAKLKLRLSLAEGCVLVVVVFIMYVFSMLFGIPVHDFNLWRLENRYEKISNFHPSGTKFVKSEKYLGGPSTHGSWQCVYAVGEIRSTKLSKQEIQQAYKNVPSFGTRRYPAKFELHFSDFESMPLIMPITYWLDDLEYTAKSSTSTGLFYLIYVAQEEVPFWGDTRCDD